MPNTAPIQDIWLQNLSDLEFNFSRSPRSNVNVLPIYDFLLVFIIVTYGLSRLLYEI